MAVDRAAATQLEAYAAFAAHQLGEALALVRGGAGVLSDRRDRLPASDVDALGALEAGIVRSQRFVDDLLDYVAAGRPGESAAVALDGVVDAACSALDRELARRRPTVVRHPLPAVVITPDGARRIVVHLLRGALAAGAGHIEISGGRVGPSARLCVTDDGTAPEDVGAAVALFGHARGRGPLVGAGLSLLIARRSAEAVGGTLALHAEPGQDTTITVTLPAAGD